MKNKEYIFLPYLITLSIIGFSCYLLIPNILSQYQQYDDIYDMFVSRFAGNETGEIRLFWVMLIGGAILVIFLHKVMNINNSVSFLQNNKNLFKDNKINVI